MTIREQMIDAFKKNYDKDNLKNSYITVKGNEDIAIWSDDPDIADQVFISEIDGKKINLGNTKNEIIENIKKYNLVVNYSEKGIVVCIPKDTDIELAMDITEDLKDGSDIEIDYVSELTTFRYNGIDCWFESMNGLENIFYN